VPNRKKPGIRSVGIVVRPASKEAGKRARRLAQWLSERNVAVLAHDGWADDGAKRVRIVDRAEMMRAADLVVVLGGDGSLLGMARLSAADAAPVVGIHHGDFGFLTDSEGKDPYAKMQRILAGEFEIERRTLLDVTVRRGKKVAKRSQALNDAVVARGTLSRLVELEASVDGEYLGVYLGDGVVIATPTGSTAYSLSAGGPIVEPTMNAVVITPISPHTLNSRPIVLPDSSRVAIRVSRGGDDVVLSLDGQESIRLERGDVVEVTKSRHYAAIVKVSGGEGFFAILRRKLNWGARGETLGRGGKRRRG
jgi:NAD+ kinase